MAVADKPHAHDDHHHDHGEFIAHHFDSAEQQFDSGKLGIWIFLVTEVLFFGGLFVAYTLYRFHHPEIFEQAHVFLDKKLGGLNTIVLLFSSLTMALAVRSAQLGKNKNCAVFVLITMICASVFLGVKAVEYSHKWDIGIFVRGSFLYTNVHALPKTLIGQKLNISDWLVMLSIIPSILLGLCLIASVLGKLTKKPRFATFMAGMTLVVGGYFLGAAGGQVYMLATDGGTGGSHAAVNSQPLPLHASTILPTTQPDDETAHSESADSHGTADHKDHPATDSHEPLPKFDRDIGIFFSIYYCMTGLHAVHIVAGILALAWIYWRALCGHWRSDYFGPVDYVGLYWHLVDLIWIFLFPLLYLIE